MGNRGGRPAAGRSGAKGDDVSAVLDEALAHQRAGRLAEAERLYRRILDLRPGHADALHFLGVAALQAGRPDQAVELIGKVARRRKKDPHVLNNLGEAYRALARLDDAAKCYRRAIALDARDPAPRNNLGTVLLAKGDAAGAVACFERALAAAPNDAEILSNLGGALLAKGDADEAMRQLERARAAAPANPVVLFNLGDALRKQDKLAGAVDCFRQALTSAPGDPEILNNLGITLSDLGAFDDAADCFRRALDAAPGNASAFNNLAGVLEKQGKLDDAIAACDRAIAIDASFAEAHNNRGNMLYRLGRLNEGVAGIRRALAIKPGYAEAHRNLAHALLLTGDLAQGWREHEWRWRCRDFPTKARPFPQPSWAGENPKGKTLLVWGEQGVGDEVSFAGMVPDLLERGAEVVLECDPRLAALFRRSFAGVDVVPRTVPPAPRTLADAIDFQSPSGNLGRWLRPTLKSFPRRTAYLAADPGQRAALTAKYRRRGAGGRLVGIAWVSKNIDFGEKKSMAMAELAPLAAVSGVTLVDLQYGDTEAERREFAKTTGVAVVHDDDVDQMTDLDSFAAQVAALDLVVSVSNTTVHVAGGLGVPTWVMLPTAPMWRWMKDRADNPWYPSMRLFRQALPGDWRAVIAAVARDLAAFAA